MDRIIRTCSALAAALALSLPVAAAADPGAYVRARAADADGATESAAAGYSAALAALPGDQVIAIRAYREALSAGDIALALRAVAVLDAARVAPADAQLLLFAAALARDDIPAARRASDRLGAGALDFLTPVLDGWLALAAGEVSAAIAEPARPNAIGSRYLTEHRALLLLATGKTQEGVAAVRAALTSNPASLDLRLAAAGALAADNEPRLARALLTGDDRVIAATRDRLGDGTRLDARRGVAILFGRLAADLGRDGPAELGVTLTRSALLLDAKSDRARLLLADALAKDDLFARALTTLDAVDREGPFASTARALRIAMLNSAGRAGEALAQAAALALSDEATPDDLVRHADLLLEAGRNSEAVAAYDRALAGGASDPRWSLLLQKGAALDRAGRDEAALAVLREAVRAAPDQPLALNYLGYALLEQGGDSAEALKLIQRADALQPGDAAITDSLGFAYLIRGDTGRAVTMLERAARAEPADVTINEHLGDAYWQAGRRFEARYAWAAAALYAVDGDATRLAGKVARGPAQ